MSPVWFLLTLLPVLGGGARFNCKGRILGAYYADAKSGCKTFHVCVRVAGGGIRDFRFFCPPGTLFHQEAQTCTDWGDDDPLACPANIYDGQFDLYKIGSGFDTKKLSSYGNRDDETEFGLQRAETGDRRLAKNNVTPNQPESDLRAAHSSDFFSGQRDHGRDENSPSSQAASPAPPSLSSQSPTYSRQSFRRSSTQRTFPTTQNTTPAPSSHQPPNFKLHNRSQYDVNSKRKLVKKRPIYVAAKSITTTLTPITTLQENYPQPIPVKQTQQNYVPPQKSQQNFNPQQNFNHNANFNNYQDFNQRGSSQSKQPSTTTPDVPPQYREYKDEYVEVSRVAPKQNRYFSSSTSATAIPQTTNTQRYNKNDGPAELFNYNAHSTPELKVQNANEPFKVNTFNVVDPSRNPESSRAKSFNFNNARESPTTIDYSVTIRGFPTSTPSYKNYNSVSYEPEKNNFVSYSKQKTFNNNYPTTTAAPITTFYTTSRSEPPLNLNTVAYNTNIGFNAPSNNYADSNEDDGQYHPPEGEDDGQYKPEIYDRELLAGAHSLNIAASGNRLQEDRKTYSKTQFSPKIAGQTASPRPFRLAQKTIQPSTKAPEPLYTTTFEPFTVSTQRTFDYIQTYTTTSRPVDFQAAGQSIAPANDVISRSSTTAAPRTAETRPPRPTSRPSVPPIQTKTAPPRASTRPPNFAYPANNKEDTSYDYAYYDSDPGFVEYDHIEEFGKTNKKGS